MSRKAAGMDRTAPAVAPTPTASGRTPVAQRQRINVDAPPRKRRDGDPIRVYEDGRLAYWTGGAPGLGQRRFRRFGSAQEAEEVAAALRPQLVTRAPRGPRASQSLDTLFRHMRDTWTPGNGKTATLAQYRSNWNVWVAESIGKKACDQLTISDWSAIFANLSRQRASLATIRAVARTLNAVIKHGILNGFFLDENAFGLPTQRKAVVANAVDRTPRTNRRAGITLGMCPTVADVDRLAAAFAVVYPGYGDRLVWMAFATGMRLGEVLALRVEHVNLKTGEVAVLEQLDRSQPWPATRLPKYDKTRTARMWAAYWHVAASLVADANARTGDDAGWLFPRHRSTRRWLDQAGRLAAVAREQAGWGWTLHFLRHAHASYSLAPVSYGGYGLDPKSVSECLGHEDLSTTLDMYVAEQPEAAAIAARLTRHPPGLVAS